jgi:hypothetical protein
MTGQFWVEVMAEVPFAQNRNASMAPVGRALAALSLRRFRLSDWWVRRMDSCRSLEEVSSGIHPLIYQDITTICMLRSSHRQRVSNFGRDKVSLFCNLQIQSPAVLKATLLYRESDRAHL